jgi:putative colanic acid biosynthesis glycosyltransferase
MGLPVIATDIGALRERIVAHKGGWLVDYKDPAILWAQIEKITQNMDDYLEIYNMIGNIPIRSEEQMAEDYFKIYKNLSDAGGCASLNVQSQ